MRRRAVALLRMGIAAVGAALLGGIIPVVQHGGEVERSTDALTTEAQRQIGLQYDTADGQDIKTLGMVAAAVAGVAIVSSTQHSWSSWWAVPLLFLLAVIACFLKSLDQRRFERGPSVPDLYRNFSGTLLEVKGLILQELVRALEHNKALLPPKTRWYARGCWALVLAGWSTVLVLLFGL